MPNLTELRDEHARLLVIAGRLSDLTAKALPPSWDELHVLRRQLAATLIGHLKAEDWMLYPRLLDSPDRAVKRMARAFGEEMGWLAGAFMTYSERWGTMAIQRDWLGYCRDTATITAALTQRIMRENRELYPLLDDLDRAA